MVSQLCIDASVALLWILPAQQSLLADSLLQKWDGDGIEIISPPLFDIEITSVLHKYLRLKILLPEQGEQAYQLYRDLDVTILSPPELSMKAWLLAKEYYQVHALDMQYLALAELVGCEFWTADKTLFNNLKDKNQRVRFIGENVTSSPAVEKKIEFNGTDFPGLWRRF
jgi:predicted nucleic acid-binding protein